MSAILDVFLGYALLVIVIAFLISLISSIPNKTRRYRRELTDMYVSGRIKQLAEKDGINLEEEYKAFRLYHKKQRAEDKPLDDAIEMELQDKIVDGETKEKKK